MIGWFRSLFIPSTQLVAAVHQRAQTEAAERGVSIDQICVMATPWGSMHVTVLDQATINAEAPQEETYIT